MDLLYTHSIEHLPEQIFKECFDVVKRNLLHEYRSSKRGWSDELKLSEMCTPGMRFLILARPPCKGSNDIQSITNPIPNDGRSADEYCKSTDLIAKIDWNLPLSIDKTRNYGEVIAFASFLRDREDGHLCMYVYELQVAEAFRGQGLGTKLLAKIVQIARKQRIRWIALNVFTFNKRAIAFYDKLGFFCSKKPVHDEMTLWLDVKLTPDIDRA